MDKRNIDNLLGLWHYYGAHSYSGSPNYYVNRSWPYRVWGDNLTGLIPSAGDLNALAANAVMPVRCNLPSDSRGAFYNSELTDSSELALNALGWYCDFEQTAMFRLLDAEDDRSFNCQGDLQIITVSSLSQLRTWLAIASDAFGYSIDGSVFTPLLDHKDIKLFLLSVNGEWLATALLYKTGEVVGVHQVGVSPRAQGCGIANQLMNWLIGFSCRWGGRAIVLQASQAGRPLYERLGFSAQFSIKNFRKVANG